MHSETGELSQINQRSGFGEWVGHAEPAPHGVPRQDVSCHRQRQLAIRLDVERFKSPDESTVGSGCNPDPHLATRRFQQGKVSLDPTNKINLGRRMRDPGLVADGNALKIPHQLTRRN